MESLMLINLSRQVSMRRTMDVIANNLANMNTTAFKAESVLFKEHLQNVKDTSAAPSGGNLSFVMDYGLSRNFEEGQFTTTGNPLDLAISGEGYLTVETPDGDRYTRNGNLRLDEEGLLVTENGYPVLDQDGRTITVDPTRTLTISEDGTVNAAPEEEEPVRLMLVTFADQEALEKTGSSLYRSDAAPQPTETAKVMQGMLESSNVSPILEMTKMIQTSRAYQRATQTEEQTGDLSRRAIERLGRVQG